MAGNSRLNRYSLADYQLTVTFDSSIIGGTGNETSIVIGGVGQNNNGSYVGDMTVQRNNDLWTTDGDATGSWVHSKNYNRTGRIDINISQVSDQVLKLAYICNAYESTQENVGGMNMILTNAVTQEKVVDCTDCYITKIPNHDFKDTASRYTWTFTVGKLLFYPENNW